MRLLAGLNGCRNAGAAPFKGPPGVLQPFGQTTHGLR